MILLKFDTEIKGDSTVDSHEDWITVDSVQLGVGRSISISGGGKSRDTSNPSFSEITFSKSTDKASANLFMEAICGKSLGTAHVHFYQTAGSDSPGQVYLTLELQEAILSSYSMSSGGDRPSESFSINFTKVSYQFDDYTGDKKTSGTPQKWDLMSNKKF